MDINIDDKTAAHLQAIADHQNKPPELVAAEWLSQVSQQRFIADQTREDDMQRLAAMKANGGIPHDDMMDWLDDLAAGKDV